MIGSQRQHQVRPGIVSADATAVHRRIAALVELFQQATAAGQQCATQSWKQFQSGWSMSRRWYTAAALAGRTASLEFTLRRSGYQHVLRICLQASAIMLQVPDPGSLAGSPRTAEASPPGGARRDAARRAGCTLHGCTRIAESQFD